MMPDWYKNKSTYRTCLNKDCVKISSICMVDEKNTTKFWHGHTDRQTHKGETVYLLSFGAGVHTFINVKYKCF